MEFSWPHDFFINACVRIATTCCRKPIYCISSLDLPPIWSDMTPLTSQCFFLVFFFVNVFPMLLSLDRNSSYVIRQYVLNWGLGGDRSLKSPFLMWVGKQCNRIRTHCRNRDIRGNRRWLEYSVLFWQIHSDQVPNGLPLARTKAPLFLSQL